MVQLNEENFLDFCQAAYTNEHCIGIDEFLDDLKILKYIKVLLRKHLSNKEINELLLLNHFQSFFNVFEQNAAVQIIFFRVEDYYWSGIKTVLEFLNMTPETFISSDNTEIFTDDIEINVDLMNKLNNLNIKRRHVY